MLLQVHRNSSDRLMGPKMTLRLGFVDHVDRIVSPIWVQPVALLESSETSGTAHLEFSYIPLSQRKSQVVCCRERLLVSVSKLDFGIFMIILITASMSLKTNKEALWLDTCAFFSVN